MDDLVNFFFETHPVIIYDFQVRMTQPLIKSLKVQGSSLVKPFVSMFVRFVAIKLLRSQSRGSQVYYHIISSIGEEIHRPELLLQNDSFALLGAVGKVVTDSSVTYKDHVLILGLCQLLEISLHVHLLLAN